MKKIFIILSLILLASCDRTIHEYPTPTKAMVILEFNVDRRPPDYYKKVEFDENFHRTVTKLEEKPALPYTLEKGYLMRITAEVFNAAGNLVARRVMTRPYDELPPQDTIHLFLHDGKYSVAAFADYVKEDSPIDWHYQTKTMKGIDTDLSTYPENAHLRSCAAGTESFIIDFRLTPEGYPALAKDARHAIYDRIIPVFLERPNGRYRITALDYGNYLLAGGASGDISVKVTYRQFASVGYNVLERKPNKFIGQYSFKTRPQIYYSPDHNEISLAIDYIFTDWEAENTVMADFQIYDNNKEISHIMNVEIPLKRNHETILEGYFLTKSYGKNDGIKIDENFDGEFIIKI